MWIPHPHRHLKYFHILLYYYFILFEVGRIWKVPPTYGFLSLNVNAVAFNRKYITVELGYNNNG
jgi:hypothetical protein